MQMPPLQGFIFSRRFLSQTDDSQSKGSSTFQKDPAASYCSLLERKKREDTLEVAQIINSIFYLFITLISTPAKKSDIK